MKSRLVLSLALFAFLTPVYSEELFLYTVKKGEVLLSILRAHNLRPSLGKNGFLKKTIALNPVLVKSKGNLILPNQQIYLPIIKTETHPIPAGVTNSEPNSPIAREVTSEVEPTSFLASLTISMGTGFLRSEAKDSSNSTGTTDSKSFYVTNLSYRQNWEDIGLTTIFDLGLNSIHLSPSPVEKHSREKFNLTSYGVGIEKRLSENGSLLGGIHFDPVFYVYSRTAQTINTDVAQVGTLHLGWKQNVLKYKKINGHLTLNALNILPQKTSTLDFKSSWGGEIGYQNEYREKDWAVQGNVAFKKSFIETNLEDIQQTGFIVSLGYSCYFD